MEENRRATDKMLLQLQADIHSIKEGQEAQSKKIAEVAEIITVWNDTKGFVKTIRIIASILKWFVVFGGTIYAVYQFLKLMGR
jgi:hypothetical protein